MITKDARLSALEDGDSDDQESNLINCETVRVGPRGRSEASAAVFSSHTDSPFDVYITNSRGIHMISTARWVEALIGETRAEGGEGIDVRIDVLVQGLQSEVQTLASHQNDGDVHDYENEIVVNACITLTDSDLGKFVFAVIGGEVYAVTLNRDDERSRLGASHLTAPSVALVPMQEAEGAWNENLDGDTLALTAHGEPRPAYRPAGEFWATSELKVSILEKMRADGRSRRWYTDSIRLSPATLDLLTEAHRILSKETYATGVAAAELFRRCERLRDELSDQVRKINIIAYRVEQHVDEEDGDGESGRQHDDATVDSAATASDKSEDIDNEDENRPRRERRMSVIRSRQQELRARHEALQRKMGRVKGLRRGGTEIGDAERAWMREVEKAEGSVRKDGDVLGGDDGRGDDDDTFDNDSDGGEKGQDERAGSMVSTRRRYEAAKQLAQSLVKTGRSLLPPDDEMTPGKAKQGKQNGSGIVGGGRESAVNEVEEWADYEDESGSENGYETANERGGENHRQRQNGAVRKEQTEGLMRMLERESALVEAATARLQRLSTAVKATV